MLLRLLFLIPTVIFLASIPFAFADKTITIDELPSGDFTITPDPLFINTGEKVTFEVTDSVLTTCMDNAKIGIAVIADDVFPNSDGMHFRPTPSDKDFTTVPFVWPSAMYTYTYTIRGDCVPTGLTDFSIGSAVFKKNFIIQPEWVDTDFIVTQDYDFSYSFPDDCELISGEPCIPEFEEISIPDRWGPVCLTCPPEIMTQFGLVYDVVLDQKIGSLGNTVQNMQSENKIIMGLVTISIVLGVINLVRSSRKD